MEPPRYAADDLLRFARVLLERAGLDTDKARAVADVLLEADLLGHDTHGLSLLASYLGELEGGGMSRSGQPRVVHDKPAALTWDGKRLPGPWLVLKAIEAAIPRARQLGTCSVVISRSHHIACLASYLQRVADQGLMILLMTSAPDNAVVAPHGGMRGVMTPNPIAAGWPTGGDPVLLDVSMSYSTNMVTARLHREGKRYPGLWVIDGQGNPSDDPRVMFSEPRGAMLPLGGVDAGHKGFALGLLVEALSGGLPGHARAEPQEGWVGNVFLELLDPACFGGLHDFVRQMAFLGHAVHATPPRPGFDRVRLPGERGLERRRDQLANGVRLHADILPALRPWAGKLGVTLPAASNQAAASA
jgi:L-lactate dehydrogenase